MVENVRINDGFYYYYYYYYYYKSICSEWHCQMKLLQNHCTKLYKTV